MTAKAPASAPVAERTLNAKTAMDAVTLRVGDVDEVLAR